ncbi:MAG: ATP-binding protein [Betaproteobacteria bacterium]|nr:ATP-binding protein [Betaproteobacteria bacterium]
MECKQRKFALNGLLAAHFAPAAPEELVVARQDFPHWARPDLQRGLEALFAVLPGHRFVGARLRDHDLDFRFADLAEAGRKAVAIGPAVYEDIDIGEARPVRCLTRGLWFAERDAVRFAVLLDAREGYRGVRVRLEIAVAPGEAAVHVSDRIASELRAAAESGASWGGKALVLDHAHDEFEISAAGLRVEKVVPVRREDIVLPDKTLALIERNTLGFARQAEQLKRLGLSARKGVLLYGPPGTGKTLVARWLVGALEGYTKLIVTAGNYGLLEDTLAIARALQPALVVLEDIDLVGGHRDGPWAAAGGTLNMLLNEMDGLAPEARILFVLTTNRPEVLEPALAARPGRVDQAIEIDLPGEAERRRLVERYAGGLAISEELVAQTAKRTGRVSAALIKELMRRAAQVMLERGGERTLELRDVERALRDMLGAGGKLGARALGAEAAAGFTAAFGDG